MGLRGVYIVVRYASQYGDVPKVYEEGRGLGLIGWYLVWGRSRVRIDRTIGPVESRAQSPCYGTHTHTTKPEPTHLPIHGHNNNNKNTQVFSLAARFDFGNQPKSRFTDEQRQALTDQGWV